MKEINKSESRKHGLLPVIMLLCLLLAFSACSGKKAEEIKLKDLVEPNTFENIVKTYGSFKYEYTEYYSDGSTYVVDLYQDENRYVAAHPSQIEIIEKDDNFYGYNLTLDIPYKLLCIPDSTKYLTEHKLDTILYYSEEEKIISRKEKDGIIYLKTEGPASMVESSINYYGYTLDRVEKVEYEYTVDKATKEIITLDNYFVIDGKAVLYISQMLERGARFVPEEDKFGIFSGEETVNYTVVTDAGTDEEKSYKKSVPEGVRLALYPDAAYFPIKYADPECTLLYDNNNTLTDKTIYLKRKTDYSNKDNWAYFAEGEGKEADLFLVAPTVDTKDEDFMSLNDEKTKKNFLGALNMERGIYDDVTRMYAPYYSQCAMRTYSLSEDERTAYFESAYKDVEEAFLYYLEHENNGRPIVLAGFSQGAEMVIRLLADHCATAETQEKIVATYAIGWPLYKETVDKYSHVKPAQSETDTGVVISFDCEAPEVTETFITPLGTKAYTINPLTWTTDTAPADKSLNLGACFTDYDANINSEIKGLCGCYIDENRPVLKVTDIDPADYPAYLDLLPEGGYHIYDYQFFYRNLEENVAKRLNAYLEK
ncbi:MAG: DUF3089 domain-containing protein [Lachnospiraceae bacterium]|nr:DUF3089 domain-containing protein [Lachnospiraceae bacterium]